MDYFYEAEMFAKETETEDTQMSQAEKEHLYMVEMLLGETSGIDWNPPYNKYFNKIL